MPGLIADASGVRKRKRIEGEKSKATEKTRKAPKTSNTPIVPTEIASLEEQALDSRKLHGTIVKSLEVVADSSTDLETTILTAVTLCRTFCRLIAGEHLVKRKDSSEKDVERVQKLRSCLLDFCRSVATWIGSSDGAQENTALTLLMRIVKTETSTGRKSGEQVWRTEGSSFYVLVQSLLAHSGAEGARQEFVDRYVEEFDDIRFHTLAAVRQILRKSAGQQEIVDNALDMLSHITGIPEVEDQLEDWYGSVPESQLGNKQLLSLNAHQKGGREAWLAIFQSELSAEHRRTILGIMNAQILPWFADHLELLTDFLTDSFNQGGSTALFALNGIFHLMTDKNIDYPEFYTKLYSLLDEDILHSKQRNHFFRLLETFMASTHLPAAMVASFIKRLSRLALRAPPGSIVWIVPWTYNMLKQHPPCSFMLHRPFHPAHVIYASHPNYEDEGMADPFNMNQPDPLLTGAIDSSLWELETLRSHYHPNVATLAKIIGEQFTKRDYQLEDFLDHSYATLVDAELEKELKKAPVVEWDIPKRIVTTEDGGLDRIGAMLQNIVNSS